MDQLIRETQPPAGTPPSAVPQYWNPDAGEYERVEGSDGATKVQLTGHTMDLRGPASARPSASSVDDGTTYWSVDTGDVSVAHGSTWRKVGDA